jgi:hypothetical protein
VEKMASGFLLYHVTSARVAAQILRMGFADGEGSYMSPGLTSKGVFLSNRTLLGPFARAAILEVCFSVSLGRLDEFEIVEDELEYREWCVPAAFIKRWAEVRLVEIEGSDDFSNPNIEWGLEIARLRNVRGSDQRHTLEQSESGKAMTLTEPQLRQRKAPVSRRMGRDKSETKP